jgi:hypothetical protein
MESHSEPYSGLTVDPRLQPFRSKAGGTALLILAPILAIAGTAILTGFCLYLYHLYSQDGRFLLFTVLAPIFPVVAAGHLARTGLRLRQEDAVSLLKRDPRRPIVFVRSFVEDSRLVSNVPAGETIGGEKTGLQGDVGIGAFIFRFKKKATLEVSLARALRRVGPFVAIGQPADALAPFGAARLYVSNDHWRTAVAAWVRVAGAVVVQPEASEGTWWEVNHVATSVDLRRVLIIVPNPSVRPLGYARIQSLTARVLPTPLPVRTLPCDAFMFDHNYRPRPLNIGRDTEEGLKPFIDQIRALNALEKI